MKISVILTVYKEFKYVATAINSILEQTFRDFELIIVDDSVDEKMHKLLDVIAESDNRIRIIKNDQNIGLTKSLNIGLRQATGEYIARMDADDLSLPERFQKQVDFLDNNPDYGVVGTWVKKIDSNGKVFGEIKHYVNDKKIKLFHFLKVCFIHPSVMIRRNVLEEVGYYNEEYSTSQDAELWFRILQKYKGSNIPEFLVLYRIHKNSISGTKNKTQRKNGIKVHFNYTYSSKVNIIQFVFGNLKIVRNIFLLIKPWQHQ